MNLKQAKLVGLDTNIFVYQFAKHPDFFTPTRRLFQLLEQSHLKGVTSIITLTEILALPAPQEILTEIEETFFSTPNLNILDVDGNIAKEAASIRRDYRYRSPDAIQLATALLAKADRFITNDKRLTSFRGVKIQLLSELV